MLALVRPVILSLLRDRRLTVTAAVTIGLALGTNAAIYGVVKSVLLAPLPYANPDALVMIWKPVGRGEVTWLSLREVLEYGAGATTLSAVEGYAVTEASFTDDEAPERVASASLTPGLLAVLGVSPVVGRGFGPADSIAGAPAAVILSHGLWQRRFGGATDLVGRTVRVNGTPRTVVGILASEFRLPLDFESERPIEALMPAVIDRGNPGDWGNRSYLAVARLQPGVAAADASQELHVLADRWVRAGYLQEQDAGTWHRDAVPMHRLVTRDVRGPLTVLLAAVLGVLLIACSNVANLLLARGDARQRELAVRMALGASRTDLVRQLVAESVMLATAGAALGGVLAWALQRWLAALSPATLPRAAEITLDTGVLAASALATLLSGIVSGLVPAWRLSRPDTAAIMQEAGRSGTLTRARHAFRQALVVVQIAGSVVLLIGGVLLVRGFLAMTRVDLGFDPERVLTAEIQLPAADYPDAASLSAFMRELTGRLTGVPGVEAAGAVRVLPLARAIGDWSITVDGRPVQPAENPNADYQAVTPGYFAALRLPVRRGRALTDADREGAPAVAVINEVMAARYWPGEDAIGRRFHMGTTPRAWVTVVGIVGAVRHNAVVEDARAEMYLPYAQLREQTGSPPRAMVLTLRTAGDPLDMVTHLGETVRAMDPRLPLSQVRPMEAVVARALAAPRFTATLLMAFAALALLMAAVGIYGTVALFVAERRTEFGIRLALGASPQAVRGLVVGHAVWMSGAGLAIGALGAAALAQTLASLVYGVAPMDAATFAIVPAILAVVVLAACAGPAWRASRSDPSAVLRP